MRAPPPAGIKADKSLDTLIASYDVRDLESLPGYEALVMALASRIRDYKTLGGKAYGAEVLWPHLQRTSRDGAAFLAHLGHPDTVSFNFESAYVFSDLGKTHQDYADVDWMKEDRPSPEEKSLRRQHTAYGLPILDAALAIHAPDLADHPHICVIKALMLYHHERLDGGGPYGINGADIGVVSQVGQIIDALDGDMIQRGHQGGARSLDDALARLAAQGEDKKYHGAFDAGLLDIYTNYKRKPKA
jgi:HD-GYP domain-containing protein (c-di-GMP phosphodiesterase class II)